MTTFKQAYNLFKIICKDTFQKSLLKLGKKQDKEKENIDLSKKPSNKSASKIAFGALMVFALAMIIFYIVTYAVTVTTASIQSGYHEELLYYFITLVQLVVVFFGSAAILNYLYFSKDNQLLASLPVTPRAIFIAKYGMAYLSELLICLLFSLPLLITYGVTCGYNGINIGASFYIITIISAFLLPIFPLLIASLISIPLMYVVSFLKKRTVGNAIVIAIVTIGVLTLYLSFIGSVTNMTSNTTEDGSVLLTGSLVKMFVIAKKFTIFNYPLVNSLLNNNAALNFFIYIAGLAVVFALAIFISSAFYYKGMRIIIEGSGTTSTKKNAKVTENYENSGFTKSFVKKEIKSLINTPALFISSLIGIIIIPVFAFIFGNTFNLSEDGITTYGSELAMIGLVLYMASIMMASGNTVAIVGISLEGKNLYLLKSLPIKAKDIIKPKLIVSNSINALMALITAIAICFVSDFHNVLIALLILIILLIGGFGTTCYGLYNDLKHPNLNYKNVTELTKNNKRIIKPMLINVGIGFSYMIMGMVFAFIDDSIFAPLLKYSIFFGVELLINILYASLAWKHLVDHAEEKYENLEV